ncbi:MAG: hypothetical protein N2039_15375 [Gemmataceae bacterium]|nr:hypothetical protein [Gemmataceae bacterium]
MISGVCPICGARNVRDPKCRRCRADLSLLRGVEEYRAALLSRALRALGAGQIQQARDWLAEAERVHPGRDIARFAAVAALMMRDFSSAWRHYLQAKTSARES